MTRICTLSVCLSVCSVLLCACFSAPAKQENFYNLHGPKSPSWGGKGSRILVASFTSSAGYDTARLAYRTSGHELRYFGYRQWVAEPARMLSEMTVRHLRISKLFKEVATNDKIREPDAVVEGNVDAIEEVDKGEHWKARLAMTFVVRKGHSEEILLRHTFDVTRDCKKPHPNEVAREVSEILAQEVKRLSRRISTVMK
jgi:ABC-type uncharacterized transport system auxiliary subunit